jgi:hypothetical protein
MKILTLSYDDYANLAQDHTRAMVSVGLDASSIKLKAHAFAYTDQARVVSIEQMGKEIMEADVVIIYHSSLHILGIVQNFVDKSTKTVNSIAFHSGTTYRENPESIRQTFDKAGVKLHLTDQTEFLLNPIGEDLIYVAAAIDVQRVRAQGLFPQIGSTRVIAHYPSKSEVKGTEKIQELIAKHGKAFNFMCSTERVPHCEQIRRMSYCDIYLELFKNELEGKAYGCYGVTAFEAAALGRIVITQNINEKAYLDAYRVRSPFLICNTEEALENTLRELSQYTVRELQRLQEETYQWILSCHSLQATGKRFSTILSQL